MVSRDGGTGIGCAVALVLVQLVLGWGGCLGNVGGSEVLCGLCCAVLCCAAATGELGGGMWTGHFGIFTVDVRYCSSILSIIYAGRVVI